MTDSPSSLAVVVVVVVVLPLGILHVAKRISRLCERENHPTDPKRRASFYPQKNKRKAVRKTRWFWHPVYIFFIQLGCHKKASRVRSRILFPLCNRLARGWLRWGWEHDGVEAVFYANSHHHRWCPVEADSVRRGEGELNWRCFEKSLTLMWWRKSKRFVELIVHSIKLPSIRWYV